MVDLRVLPGENAENTFGELDKQKTPENLILAGTKFQT